MTGIQALALAKKATASVAAGIDNYSVDGQTLVITAKDGTVLNLTFPTPADGKSAYEIAREHGYAGTEAQWIEEMESEEISNAEVLEMWNRVV